MSKQLSDEELFQKLVEASGETLEQIKADYTKIVEEVKKDERFVNIDETAVNQIAKNRLITTKRREMASPAITWEGIIIGIMDLVDTVATQRRFTEAAFKADPIRAVEGYKYQDRLILADENGKALYPKTENNDKWKRTGKPLPDHSWLRNLIAVASPIDKKTRQAGVPRIAYMTLSNQKALAPFVKTISMNTPIRFKGINKTTAEHDKAGVYNITDSSFTIFESAPDLKLPPIETILTSACSSLYKTLGELEEYHLKAQSDYSRVVITEGTVSILALEPNAKTGNMRMVLDDESLLFAPEKEGRSIGVTCWIPTDRNIVMDFIQDSRVYVVARTSQGKKTDMITGQKTDELGDVMLNIFGIYCPEMFKVRVSPVEVPANALENVLLTEGKTEEEMKEEW